MKHTLPFKLKPKSSTLRPFISYLPSFMLASFLFAQDAIAAKDNATAMKTMVESAEHMFAGSFLQIALNFGGLAAIGYSILGGFRAAPFIGGAGLLIFNALYFGYLKSYFG